MKNARLCSGVSSVPKTAHWAIVVFGERFIPGMRSLDLDATEDAREPTTEYWAFTEEGAWREAAESMTRAGRSDFLALTAKPSIGSLSFSMEG